MYKFITSYIFVLGLTSVKAQIFEPFNLRYQHSSTAKVSKAGFEDFENTERTEQQIVEATFRYPIIFGKRNNIFLPELSHKIVGRQFDNWRSMVVEPATGNLTRLFLKGIFPVSDKWNILGVLAISQGVNSGVSWSFNHNYYRYGAGLVMNNKKGNQIGVSLLMIEELGFPAPAFIFRGTNGKNWNYSVTFPLLTIIEYNLNKKWRLRFEEHLDNDRFVLNINSRANYNQAILNLSIGLSYQLAKPIFMNVQAGLTPLNVLTYYEDKTTDIDTVSFDMQPTFGASIYISVNPKDYISK
ncbi:hypothetical protein [Aquimarina agarilytica]|uniref:hypothetical protein n=1 Tax=Aquimarina agarilytica TaxID=1087449 RepID=UPI000289C126|nr:hypothetical protein [Aquimarina agarilytica]